MSFGDKENLGKNLKVLRIVNRLTFDQLAKETKISQSFLCEIEKNCKTISIHKLNKLAAFYSIDLDTLVNDELSLTYKKRYR